MALCTKRCRLQRPAASAFKCPDCGLAATCLRPEERKKKDTLNSCPALQASCGQAMLMDVSVGFH